MPITEVQREVAIIFKVVKGRLVADLKEVNSTIQETINTSGGLKKTMNTVTTGFGEQGKIVTKTIENYQRFRGELLSTMFYFGAIAKATDRALAPAMQMFKVNEMFSNMMAAFFAPTMMLVLPLMMGFFQVSMMIPAPIRMIIGAILGLIGIYAKYRMWQSMIKLGNIGLQKEAELEGRAHKGLLTSLLDLGKKGFDYVGKTIKNVWNAMKGMKDSTKGTSSELGFLGFIFKVISFVAKPFIDVLMTVGATFLSIGWPVLLIVGLLLLIIGIFTIFRGTIEGWGAWTWEQIHKVQVKWEIFKTAIWMGWRDIKSWFANKIKAVVEWVQEKWNDLMIAKDKVIAWFKEKFKAIIEWVQEKWEIITTSFENAKKWAGEKLEPIVKWIREKWEDITSAFDTLKIEIGKKWEVTVDFFKGLWKGVNDFINDIKGWVSTGFSITVDFFKGLWSGVQNFVDKIVGWASKGFEIGINFIVKAGQWIADILKKGYEIVISALGVKKFQEGGIVTRPTFAMIGERGPEAVVPLGKGPVGNVINYSPTFYIENNISSQVDVEDMIDKVESRLSDSLRRVIR